MLSLDMRLDILLDSEPLRRQEKHECDREGAENGGDNRAPVEQLVRIDADGGIDTGRGVEGGGGRGWMRERKTRERC